jgi:hypothetical protein
MSARDELLDEYGRAETAPLGTLGELRTKLEAIRAEVLAEVSARGPLSAERLAQIASLIGDAKPATDELLVSFGKSVRDRREHDHATQHEDWFCMNLAAYMGERMGPVLRRLLDAEARVAELEQAKRNARRAGFEAAIDVMRQERLPMSVGLLEAQLELDADEARARVAELEQHTTTVRAETLREAADVIDSDDDCDCGGCDSCVPRRLADQLRRMAAEGGGPA